MMQKARKQDMLQWSLIGSWREGRLEGEEGEGGSGRGREGKGEGGEGGGRGRGREGRDGASHQSV